MSSQIYRSVSMTLRSASSASKSSATLLAALYQELGERGNEMGNVEYERKKMDDLQKRLSDARSSIHHIELIEKTKFKVQHLHEVDIKRAIAGPSMRVNLDIPESIGLSTPSPAHTTSRLVDIVTGMRALKRLALRIQQLMFSLTLHHLKVTSVTFLQEAAVVPTSYKAFEDARKETFQKLG